MSDRRSFAGGKRALDSGQGLDWRNKVMLGRIYVI